MYVNHQTWRWHHQDWFHQHWRKHIHFSWLTSHLINHIATTKLTVPMGTEPGYFWDVPTASSSMPVFDSLASAHGVSASVFDFFHIWGRWSSCGVGWLCYSYGIYKHTSNNDASATAQLEDSWIQYHNQTVFPCFFIKKWMCLKMVYTSKRPFCGRGSYHPLDLGVSRSMSFHGKSIGCLRTGIPVRWWSSQIYIYIRGRFSSPTIINQQGVWTLLNWICSQGRFPAQPRVA